MSHFQNFKSFAASATGGDPTLSHSLTVDRIVVPKDKVGTMLRFEDCMQDSPVEFSYDSAAIDSNGGSWRGVSWRGTSASLNAALELFSSFGLGDAATEAE